MMSSFCSVKFSILIALMSWAGFSRDGIPPPWLQDPDAFIDSMGADLVDEEEPADWFINREDLNGGKVTSTIGSGSDAARAGIIQRDGKIVLGGRTSNNGANDFALMRFFPDGSIDTAYGTNGRTITTFGTSDGSDEVIHSMALQTDGKVVAAGKYYTDTGDYKFALARYTTNGLLDTSFNSTGKVSTNILGGADIARAVVVDTSARILIGGYGYNSTKWDSIVVRYLSDGSLDTSYYTTGARSVAFSANDNSILALYLNTAGELYTAGAAHNGTDFDFALGRFLSNGLLDTSFHSNGKQIRDIGDNDFAYGVHGVDRGIDGFVTPVGGVTSGTSTQLAIAQFSTTGVLDTGFGTVGFVLIPKPAGISDTIGHVVRWEANNNSYFGIKVGGKALVSGTSGDWNFFMGRVYGAGSGGMLDTSFGSAGYIMTSFGTSEDAIQAFAAMGDDVHYAIGRSKNGSNYQFTFARFETDGSLAPSGSWAKGFGTGGHVAHNIWPGKTAAISSLIQETIGRVIGAGFVTSGVHRPFLARFLSTGQLDDTFGTNGSIVLSGTASAGRQAILDTSGNIVLVGGNGTMIARFRTNGTLDTSFNTTGYGITSFCSGAGGFYAVALDGIGRYYVAGDSSFSIVVARYSTDGTLDTTFSVDGVINEAGITGTAYSIIADASNDGVTLGANNMTNYYISLTRFLSSGTLDTSFNSIGKTTQSYANAQTLVNSLQRDSEGRYWTEGSLNDAGTEYGLISRYRSDGVLDTSFHTDGFSELGLSGSLGADGVLAENGKATVALSNNWLQRYSADGRVDTTFNTIGQMLVTFASGAIGLTKSPLIRHGGQMCVGGYVNNAELGISCVWQ